MCPTKREASMMRPRLRIAGVASLAAIVTSSSVLAQLGNVTYQQADVGKPVALFNETTFTGAPGGSNTVLMLRKYLVVMGSHDSGVKDGPLHVFDVKDPRSPKLLKRFTSPETAQLRELHAMPVAMIDGRDYLVTPSVSGIQFFDFTDPLNPTAAGKLTLQGVSGGDYDNAAWMVSWAWPYVYVGGTGNGIYVVDARDPMQPKLTTRIQQGELGGFRIGPVYAAGNYVVATGMDGTPTRVSVIDVGNPTMPFLLATGEAPQPMYSALVIGDRIYGSGENGQYSFLKWNRDSVSAIGGSLKMGSDKGGYCTYQDAFIFCGQSSEGYRKIDVRDETSFKQVAIADLPAADADTDFATVLGNLVYLGNDHGSGAAFLPHQMAPDTTAPKLVKGYPEDGSLQQPLSTRVTLFFSDEIALDSITTENVVVRAVSGEVVEGVFSHSSFNAVSFGARAPLKADTTYEVVLTKHGVMDLALNPIADESVLRFSTGATIQAPAGGGAGGMTGSGGTGTAGATSLGGVGVGGVGGVGGGPGVSGGMAAAGASSPGGITGGGQNESGSGPNPGGAAGALGTSTPSPAEAEGGCGCSVPGGSSGPGTSALFSLAVALVASRARRGQRQGASRT
jgi:MYXO-CTERM domain-containing protein